MRMDGIKKSNILAGVSGEYYVAAELSRLGHIASITLRNTRGIDILCSNSDSSKQVSIQVKTSRTKGNSWMLSQKSEEYYSPKHFYVFVLLNGNEHPKFFIVPSKIVANNIKNDHNTWLKKPTKSGKKRGDSSIRIFRDREEKYLDRWDLLKL